ncbi:helix-turn-helix domain-containing protein [Kaistella flava (ex Peng et al. 2021)]|uniref:Helix-turn-helix domain-containing protein n=1 Tax=Kaistella flava (ex Peng et al. 2021) TaxID=2038776 RepID=A0A7M2Y6V5_9FLAO|nr:helix-turn-helix domain-containing protein [Kaistella flava (ex Peng et al. 2021)]QOW09093.1 helix-turn-helix domain-containing protein [Kaistella flava (ex Peng et al. 2021)]
MDFQKLFSEFAELLKEVKEQRQEISGLKSLIQKQLGEQQIQSEMIGRISLPEVKDEQLLNRKEAADYLDVHVCTLERWEKSKQLTPKRIGGKIYYKKSELIK